MVEKSGSQDPVDPLPADQVAAGARMGWPRESHPTIFGTQPKESEMKTKLSRADGNVQEQEAISEIEQVLQVQGS